MDVGLPNFLPLLPGEIIERTRQITGKDGRFQFALDRGGLWLLEVEDGRPFGRANGLVPDDFLGERSLFVRVQIGPPVISYQWGKNEKMAIDRKMP
jgi:hypothetical protein